ncbi:ABC transporter substrate-binding protein [Pseudonocardia xishanensis]|uniref:ABC transporter substrate-binding protein n=1 Tax=Pseudonocardia xishanensis TaxID=630995 RepID=A0ABP8RV88_9PSEU
MRTTRAVLALALAAGLATAACGTGGGSSAPGGAQTVDITYIADLSGPAAVYGKPYVDGAKFQVDQINKAGGVHGRQLTIDVVDSGTDQKQAVAAMTAAARGDADVVMYAPIGSLALPMAPIAQQSKVPFIVGQAASKGITEAGDHVYRITTNDIHYWEPLIARMRDQNGVKSMAIVYASDNTSTTEVAQQLPDIAAKLGITVTDSVPVKSNDVDYATPAAKVLAGDPDGVVMMAVGPGNASMITTLRQRGFDGVFFGGASLAGGALVPAAAEAHDTYLATPFVASDQLPWASGVDFTKEYTAATGSAPDNFSAGGHDQVEFVHQALESLGDTPSDRNALNGALATVASKGFAGATGDPVTFADRNALTPGVVAMWDGTKLVLAPGQTTGLMAPGTS